MSPGRRNALVLGGVAAGAAAAGSLVGVFLLQSRNGVAELLRARFPDVQGVPRRLADWQGRPLLCNFWATWCAPCREEIPLLNAALHKHALKGLQVVGIAVDNARNVGDFVRSVQIEYPLLLAEAAGIDLMRALGNSAGGLPFTVLLDGRGRLRGRKLGAYSAAELATAISSILQ